MAYYLGRPGALKAIKSPDAGYDRTLDVATTAHRLLSGATAADRSVRGTRTWTLAWNRLAEADWALLQGLYTRQYGPGPFTLIDPATRNFLATNQASGTSARVDTTGFSVTGSETVASSTTSAYQGTQSLAWGLPASVTSGILRLTAPTGRDYLAVPVGEQWTAWVQALGSGAGVRARMQLVWLTAAESIISTDTDSYTTLSTSTWSRLTITRTPPTNAVYLEPRVQVDPTSISATRTVYIGAARLLLGADDSAWRPGTGLPQVSIAALKETVPALGYRSAEMTLVEVA
jgi:hypothetical protein